jgi:hypothetical protein
MSPVSAVLVQIDIQAVTLGDAAAMLQQRLPHVRCAWQDTLPDLYRCRHRRRTPGGHKLLPVARVRMPGGGGPRPVYALADIEKFIADAGAASGAPAAPVSTTTAATVTIRMPRSDLAGPWHMRRAEVAL